MLRYKDIFSNNQKWVAEKEKQDQNVFLKLSQDHNPDFLLITCCDSRVAPLQMMGAEPGEVFIHRNIGNIVNHNDPNCMSAIEYAIHYLGVKHVIVCGHYNCGAVIAADQKEKLPIIDSWIMPIRGVIKHNELFLRTKKNTQERHKAIVKMHVFRQCENVISSPSFQKALKSNIPIKIHGWVIDLESGKLVDVHFVSGDNKE